MKSFFDFKKQCDKNTEFVIFGIPWDSLSSLENADSSLTPKKLREISYELARTTEIGLDITLINACDLGDIEIDPSDTGKNIKKIEEFLKKIDYFNKKAVLVMIGGDHFCTFPIVKFIGDMIEKKEDFGVLIFDAHVDFYNTWEGSKFSHTTVSHRLYDLEYINNENLIIVGTRDIDNIELENVKNENLRYLNAYKMDEIGIQQTTTEIMQFFKKYSKKPKLYVSIDIDVLDPSIAPGTGYAIAGGISYRNLWKILRNLAKEFEIIGFDLVEVSPRLDLPNRMTQICAAKLIVEFMSFIRNKKLYE